MPDAGRRLLLPLTLATAGVLLEVVAGYWDVYSHRVVFVDQDPWWNPAHGALLVGGLLLVGSVLLWQRRSRVDTWAVPGYTWVLAGALLEVGSAVANEIWHAFVGPDPPLSPPHVGVVVGMIVAIFGVITALATLGRREAARVEGGSRNRALAYQALLVLAFAAMWLAVVGSFLFVGALLETPASRYGAALTVGVLGSVVALAAARAFDRFGPLTLTGGVVTGINWLLLVGYVGIPAYAPLPLLPFFLVDGWTRLAAPRAGPLVTSVTGGTLLTGLYNLTFFPFLFGTAVAWPHAPDPSLAGAVLAGALGGLLAHGAFERTASWARRRGGEAPLR